MSTPNFEFMDYDMPLIVGCPYKEIDGFDKTKKEYEKEFDEEDTENMYYSDLDLEYDYIYENMMTLANEINDTLHYFTIGVKSGYYSGLQFIVNTVDDLDFDKDSPYCIDNEDAHYYFDECRSKVLRKADSEKNKIRKWLYSMKDNGFMELNCDCVFSNGEAIYSIVK